MDPPSPGIGPDDEPDTPRVDLLNPEDRDIDLEADWREARDPEYEATERAWYVGFTIDEKLRKYFAERYPSLKMRPGPYATPHSHPRLAFERQYGESIIMGMADNLWVTDIGGNARRHYDRRRRMVHCCCPVLTPEDAVRVSRYQGLTNWCPNKFQDCTYRSDVYTAIHSLYYLDPEDIVYAIRTARQHRLYSLHHTFPDAYGSFGDGEAQYMISPDMRATMYTLGNVTAYHHDAMRWLSAGYYQSIDGFSAIAWSIVQTLPNSVIMLFTPAPYGLPVTISSYRGFTPTIRDTSYYGAIPLTGAAFHSALQTTASVELVNTTMHVDTLYSWGKFMIGVDSGCVENCVVPKGFIDEMASWCVLKARDPTTLSSMIAHARLRIKEYNIPPHLVPKAIIFGVALGYTLHLDTESRVISTALRENKSKFPLLNALLKMDLPFYLPEWVPVSASVLLLLPLLKWRTKITLSMGTIGTILNLFSVLRLLKRYNTPTPQQQYLDAMTVRQTTHQNFTMPNYGPIPLQGNVQVLGTICSKPLKVLHPIFPGGPTPVLKNKSVGDSSPKFSLTGVGILIPEFSPNINANTSSNDERALANRALDVKAYPSPKYDVFVDHMVDTHFNLLFPSHDTSIQYNFEAWNERFPSATKKRHQKIYAIHCDEFEDITGALRLKSFMKMEMLLNSSEVEYKESDPRLIQGSQDEYNVVCGPWVWAFSKALARCWSKDQHIYYSAGSTCEEVGHWFDIVGHNNPNKKASEADFSRYDSTQARSKLLRSIRIMVRFGMPLSIADVMKRAIKRFGATNNGLVYGIDGTMASGKPETSCGNSLNNGIDTVANLVLCNLDVEFDCLMNAINLVVLGDDNALFRDNSINPLSSQCYETAGLKSELIERPNTYDLTFCSSRFWPTNTGTVLGPKPSRVMAKLGWVVNCPNHQAEGVLKSKILSLEDSCRFIPPLHAVLQHNKKLLSATKRIDRNAERTQHFLAGQHHPTSKTWHMLEYLYEWTPLDQTNLVNMLQNVTRFPCVLTGDVLRKFVKSDGEFPMSANIVLWAVYTKFILYRLLLVYFSPFVEELIKRVVVFGIPIGDLFPIVEMLMYIKVYSDVYGVRNTIALRLPALFMHYVSSRLPLFRGYMLHVVFNSITLGLEGLRAFDGLKQSLLPS